MDRLAQLSAEVSELTERMRGVAAQHEALLKRNAKLRDIILIAKAKAEHAAAQPYYLGTGLDAGAHYGDALRDLAKLLGEASADE